MTQTVSKGQEIGGSAETEKLTATDLDELINHACFSSILDRSAEEGIEYLLCETKGMSDITIVPRELPNVGGKYLVITFFDETRGERRRVISVRGTSNFKNFQGLLKTRYTEDESLGIRIHSGFFAVYTAILNDFLTWSAEDLVKKQRKEDNGFTTPATPKKLVLTGHSLGGAVACLLAAALSTRGVQVEQVTVFGMPKFTDMIGSMKLSFLLDDIKFYRVMHLHDPVSRVPVTGPTKDAYCHPACGRLVAIEPPTPEEKEDNTDAVSITEAPTKVPRTEISDRLRELLQLSRNLPNLPELSGVQLPTLDPMTVIQTFNWRRPLVKPDTDKPDFSGHTLICGRDAEVRTRDLFKDVPKFSLDTHYMHYYRTCLQTIRDSQN